METTQTTQTVVLKNLYIKVLNSEPIPNSQCHEESLINSFKEIPSNYFPYKQFTLGDFLKDKEIFLNTHKIVHKYSLSEDSTYYYDEWDIVELSEEEKLKIPNIPPTDPNAERVRGLSISDL